jgi:SDR family mycofactocin-dependent oxidoreductase
VQSGTVRSICRTSLTASDKGAAVGRMDGKVAFITGAARGQGRSHAVRLAEEGAEIIAVDVCQPVGSAPYEMSTSADLAETAKLVEELDRRIVAREADVRDLSRLEAVVQEGVSEFGHIDVVVANAGIVSVAPTMEMDESMWQEMIDINLTGVWKTVKAAAAPMVERRQGGAVIITSSVAGLTGSANIGHYVAAKHGVVGLMRALTQELAPYMIRVNTVHPTTVNTQMVMSDYFFRLVRPDLENPTSADAAEVFTGLNSLPIPWVEPVDISNAVLWLASDEARYVTGVTLPVDAGFLQKTGGTPLVLPEA